MIIFFNSVFFLGQILSLLGLACGALWVLREALTGIVFPVHKHSSLVTSISAALLHSVQRVARV